MIDPDKFTKIIAITIAIGFAILLLNHCQKVVTVDCLHAGYSLEICKGI